MSCNDTSFLCMQLCRDPSKFWDNRRCKGSPGFSDFRDKLTRTRLWMDNGANPTWVRECMERLSLRDGGTDRQCLTDGFPDEDYDHCAGLLDLMKSCGNQKDLIKARRIHARIIQKEILSRVVFISNALLTMYAKCGALRDTQIVFDCLPIRNVVSWNVLITAYVHHGLNDEALNCIRHMQDEGISPNSVTYISFLKACGNKGALKIGEEIHAEVKEKGLLEKHALLSTSVMDMYVKCKLMLKAQEVFDKISVRDVVSWNVLISGYAQHGLAKEAVSCFLQMQDEGLSPDAVTFTCTLKACGSMGFLELGEEIHAKIRAQDLLRENVVLGNALLDMYGKCSMLAKARDVFDELLQRNIVSWNALISAYAQHGLADDVLNCFMRIQSDGLCPDPVSFVCVLKACGSVGSLRVGEEVHAKIRKPGLMDENIILGNALVDMYAKCGMVGKAQAVFDMLMARNAASWNALIAGYSQSGYAKYVFETFRKMISDDFTPDLITFLLVLSVCNHAGLVREGQTAFDTMVFEYHVSPTLEHFTCITDLLSSAGQFNKALVIIENASLSDRLPLCLAFLGACNKWVNVELGKWAFKKVMQLDGNCGPAFVSMGNIYAAANTLSSPQDPCMSWSSTLNSLHGN